MPTISAENKFSKGLEAVADQNYVEAAMHFRRAMDIEHQRRILQPDMHYLSYYGLCRATAHDKIQEGLHACKRATRARSRDPEMFLNLGRVYLLAHKKRLAYETFRTGLRLAPGHTTLARESARAYRQLPKPAAAVPEGFLARVRAAWSRPAGALR